MKSSPIGCFVAKAKLSSPACHLCIKNNSDVFFFSALWMTDVSSSLTPGIWTTLQRSSEVSGTHRQLHLLIPLTVWESHHHVFCCFFCDLHHHHLSCHACCFCTSKSKIEKIGLHGEKKKQPWAVTVCELSIINFNTGRGAYEAEFSG